MTEKTLPEKTTPPTTVVRRNLSLGDLTSTHLLYDKYIDEWRFMRAAYNGAKALISIGALTRHERESLKNYNRRMNEAYGFAYSKSIIDLFNFYLFKEPVKRNLGVLSEDELYAMFKKDCDLYGTDFDMFLLEQSRSASIEGHVGILVDKPLPGTKRKPVSRAEEKSSRVYPYVASYRAQNILDWKIERDDYNRPYLSFIKLVDDDYVYRLWWTDHWEVWKVPDDELQYIQAATSPKQKRLLGTKKAELFATGPNPIGVIPFVFLFNAKSDDPMIGASDITDISRIDASIIRNLSQSEEIINYAAFPMMRKPKQEAGQPDVDEVGVTAVLEFDPEHPESKPDWLDSTTGDPIQAIFQVIERKIAEIYRSSNAGGMSSMEISTEAKSGAALQSEFQLLNSKLVAKGNKIQECELSITKFWMTWQGLGDKFKDVTIERAETYEIESLAAELDNIMTATQIVKSDTFNKRMQKKVVRTMLPNDTDKDLSDIDKEIDEYVEPEFPPGYFEEGAYPPEEEVPPEEELPPEEEGQEEEE
jgi:hypothetical protein